MKLYKLHTEEQSYFVLAKHPTDAEEKLCLYLKMFTEQSAVVRQINFIAESTNDATKTEGKFLIL